MYKELLLEFKKLSYLLEKDFFDVDDSDQNQDQSDNNDNDQSLDFGDNDNQNGELSDVPLSETLQMRTLWAYLLYTYKLTRKLSNINDAFDPVYEKMKDLFQLFRDFVTNYEDIAPESRKKFLIGFRREFISTLKELKQKINTFS